MTRSTKSTTTSTSSKGGFSFLDMDKALSKIDGFETGSIFAENTFSEITEWIGSGNYLLNAQISGSLFGGYPNSRSIGLIGDPSTGKTFLCFNAVREAQNIGYNVIYCDTEGAMDRQSAAKFGVDLNAIRYQPIKTVSQFKNFTVNVIDYVKKARAKGSEPKIMIVLDSLGMLPTDKELRDAMEGKNAADMGLKAKELRALFRAITLDLTGAKIPLICTNHTTTGIGGFMPTKESAGGDGPIFAMSTQIFLSKAQLKEGNTKTGIIVTSNIRKSRFTIPTPVKFHISFTQGMNPYVGLQDYVSWEACGIERGKLTQEKDGTLKFEPSDSPQARWAIRHLGKTVSSGQLFSPEVFTEDVLRQLDENVIKHAFLLPDSTDNKEFLDGVDSEEEGED
jgi:RecA/RadA recombinase